jgi:hypothetical protein
VARHLVAASLLVSTLFGVGRTAEAADPDPDDVAALADEAQVDPVDLLGASNTTGLGPRTYLYAVGELERPRPTVLPLPPLRAVEPVFGVWDRLAACESGGRWNANTGNGYFGGVQFDLPSWRAAGGSGRPDQASRAEQIRVAMNWQRVAGWKAWPVCSRVIGVR